MSCISWTKLKVITNFDQLGLWAKGRKVKFRKYFKEGVWWKHKDLRKIFIQRKSELGFLKKIKIIRNSDELGLWTRQRKVQFREDLKEWDWRKQIFEKNLHSKWSCSRISWRNDCGVLGFLSKICFIINSDELICQKYTKKHYLEKIWRYEIRKNTKI